MPLTSRCIGESWDLDSRPPDDVSLRKVRAGSTIRPHLRSQDLHLLAHATNNPSLVAGYEPFRTSIAIHLQLYLHATKETFVDGIQAEGLIDHVVRIGTKNAIDDLSGGFGHIPWKPRINTRLRHGKGLWSASRRMDQFLFGRLPRRDHRSFHHRRRRLRPKCDSRGYLKLAVIESDVIAALTPGLRASDGTIELIVRFQVDLRG